MSIAQDIRKQAYIVAANDISVRLLDLADRVEACEKRERFLECLEACGVDNWDGIDVAVEMLEDGCNE